MSARQVVLVRHAQASFGAEDYDRLSPLGEQQARRLGAWLADSGIVPAAVATGPRLRHRHTAGLCLQAAGLDLPLQEVDGLDEIDFIELLARLRPDLAGVEAWRQALQDQADAHAAFQRMFEQAIARWTGGEHDHEYACTWPQFRDNVGQGLQRLAALGEGGPVWAFTSGGPIGVLSAMAAGVPQAQAFGMSWPLLNTSLTRLRLGRRGVTLVGYNAWPHLERLDQQHLHTLR